jgi:hypothetical protein
MGLGVTEVECMVILGFASALLGFSPSTLFKSRWLDCVDLSLSGACGLTESVLLEEKNSQVVVIEKLNMV